jgi:IS30 family transposase
VTEQRRRPKREAAQAQRYLRKRDLRLEIIRSSASGMLQREIAKTLGVSQQLVSLVLSPRGGVHRIEDWRGSEARLSLEDRIDIGVGCQRGDSLRAIALGIGRSPSTVSREVAAGGGRVSYRPLSAASPRARATA